MNKNKDDLPDWLNVLIGLVGLITITLAIGGPAVVFFSFAWPVVLLLVAWGVLGLVWEAVQDYVYLKKNPPVHTLDQVRNVGISGPDDTPDHHSDFRPINDESLEDRDLLESDIAETNSQWQEFANSIDCASPTIGELAMIIGISEGTLLSQIADAGLRHRRPDEHISIEDKRVLLSYLRKADSPNRVTVRARKPKKIYIKRESN